MKVMIKKKIVVSDVDGTIVRRSLVLNHATKLHEEGIIDFGELPSQWQADPKNEGLITQLAERYRDSLTGLTLDALGVDAYIQDVVIDPQNFYSTLARLLELRKSGAQVLLISGSPSFLVERFAAHFGFQGIGSEYVMDEFGRFTGECVGMFSSKAKEASLKSLGLEKYDKVLAFGDTESDRPLFNNAHYSVLVEPTKATHEALATVVNEVIYD